MALVDSIIVFVVSLLIGGFGIYAGAWLVTGQQNYSHAVVTALVGALVWGIVSFFFGWIPFLGAALTLLAYLWVINLRYKGGWVNAALIALVAIVAITGVLYILVALNIAAPDALGVPGI